MEKWSNRDSFRQRFERRKVSYQPHTAAAAAVVVVTETRNVESNQQNARIVTEIRNIESEQQHARIN